jgi:hypothetical protein
VIWITPTSELATTQPEPEIRPDSNVPFWLYCGGIRGKLGDCRTDGSIRHIAHDVATWNGIVKLKKDDSEKERLTMDATNARSI